LLNARKPLAGRLPRLDAEVSARAAQIVFDTAYLRAAQAYMLISMPTGTSTIFGVFQVIAFSQIDWRELHAETEPRTTSDIAQVRHHLPKIEDRLAADQASQAIISLVDKTTSLLGKAPWLTRSVALDHKDRSERFHA